MNNVRRPLGAAALALLALSAAACFRVHIRQDDRDADLRFSRAEREIAGLQADNPARRGRAREICVLVHNRGEGELVEVRTSMALFRAALSLGADLAEDKGDFEFERKYGLAWRGLRDLGRFGPGLLIEVDDEETRVLVWMR